MESIELDDDVYSYLLSKAVKIGESASSILRRELNMGGSIPPKIKNSISPEHEFTEILNSPKLRVGSTTDKFLALLAEAHRQKPKEFEKVLSIQGRDRVYFARSKDDIVRSGKSTQPLQIPGTTFWVMTNSPTSQKRQMLLQALDLMDYSELAGKNAAKAI